MARYHLFWVFSALILVGCAVGPDFHSPDAPTTKSYTQKPIPARTASAPVQGGKTQFMNYHQDIPSSWWTLYHSQAINDLIMQGLTNSPDMNEGLATLRQMQHDLRAESGSLFYPRVDGSFSAERERTSLLASGLELSQIPGGQPAFSINTLFNLFNASVSVVYNLDIFGGDRRHIEALTALVDYHQFELEATYLTLTSNIVTTAVTTSSLQAQIDTTEEVINNKRKQLELVKNNLKLGYASPIDVMNQERILKDTQATLPSLKNDLAKQNHALAVLIGQLPGESHLPKINLNDLQLPQQLPVTIPSLLVRQRPDIRSAEALLHKASAEVGVATANLFPSVSIGANYGYTSSVISSLFKSTNRVWNYGPDISFPLLHGGEYWARRKSAMAAYDYAAAHYRKVVLDAFKNVADVLNALEYDAEILQIRARSELLAKSRYEVIKNQYDAGKSGLFDLLKTEQEFKEARINRIVAEAQRYNDTAALFQALGGGWWNRHPLQKAQDKA